MAETKELVVPANDTDHLSIGVLPRLSAMAKHLKDLIILVPVLYAIGFIIINCHFYRHGFAETSLVRADYLLAGVMFIVVNLVIIPVSLLITYSNLKRKPNNKLDIKQKAVTSIIFLIASIIIYAISSAYASAIDSTIGSSIVAHTNLFSGSKFDLYFVSVFGPIVIAPFIYQLIDKDYLVLMIGVPATGLITAIFSYTHFIYPLIPPSVGGGMPIHAKVYFSTDLLSEKIGGIENLSGKEVFVLHKTDKSLYIATDAASPAIELPRDKILAIQYK